MGRVLMETKMIDTSTEFIHQFVETVPEGERIRLCLQHASADRLSVAPDCGLSQTARWAAKQKLNHMVAGAMNVRKSL